LNVKEWFRKYPAARILLICLAIDIIGHLGFLSYVVFFQK